jgi:hypothetical protein
MTAPPTAAATKPSTGLPEETAAAKPQIAPTIIMPSTPRLSTPDFSAIISPVAARRIGVAATIIEAMSAMISMP